MWIVRLENVNGRLTFSVERVYKAELYNELVLTRLVEPVPKMEMRLL
jgi:hypothetical protein